MEVIEVGDSSSGVTLAAASFQYAYDKEANLEHFEEFVEAAAERGANLLVFPEQSLQGYLWEAEASWELEPDVLRYHYESSETIPGPATERLRALAERHGMLLVLGMTERHPYYGIGKGGLYDSAVLLSGAGVLGVQRKVHTCGAEKHIYRSGRSIDVIETPIGRIAMLICYDMVFPEAARVAAVQGADIIVFIAAWARVFDPPLLGHVNPLKGLQQNHFLDVLLGLRAFENQVWIVFGSAAGTDERSTWEQRGEPKDYQGQAKVVDPEGRTLGETPPLKEGLVVAHGCNIEEAIVAARTTAFWGDSFMFDRRPSAYRLLGDEDAMFPPVVSTQAEHA